METGGIAILLIVIASMGFVLVTRKSTARWETSLRWLFPAAFVAAMESIALAHPFRYALLVFLVWLGICALGVEAGLRFGPIAHYGIGALVALFSLYTARVSANARVAI